MPVFARHLSTGDDAAGVRAVMEGSSSSKVTVEYHDPSGIFPLISQQLASRLPLRHLNWKSPTRPLRSIDSLHIDLVPSPETAAGSLHAPGQQANTASGGPSRPGTSAGSSITGDAPPRRHQIPGLRQTPYLKVLLLRCDDNDSYKSSARKQIREWIKTHTPPSQSSGPASSQENHDAFEWMILHVVLPNTAAAAQPRFSSSGSGAGSEKSSSSSRLLGRGSTTIYEKIRADFNVSSKSAPDRIAQIRLSKESIPPHLLPPASSDTPPPHPYSPQDKENSWNDLITKFKTLILLSFDLRVSQYEEDIREKDSQRVLPGWNFCTFFVLKEGLARGFENVGLVEDALVGYDELSAGLDSVIREQAEESSTGYGGTFLSYTPDLKDQLLALKDGATVADAGFGDSPIQSNKKNYRELIISNNISIFDFRSYIFSRQMALLLRLGNARSNVPELARKSSGLSPKRSIDDLSVGRSSNPTQDPLSEDLTALAELCERALRFITSVARILRDDVRTLVTTESLEISETFIDNFVSSWTYAVAGQVIRDTTTASLPITISSDFGSLRQAQEFKRSGKDSSSPKFPLRSTSLSHKRTSLQDPPYSQPSTGQVIYEQGRFNDLSTSRGGGPPRGGRTGLPELATHRAELYLVQRRVAEHIGKLNNLVVGWSAIQAARSQDDFADVDLEGDDEDEDNSAEGGTGQTGQENTSSDTAGLCVIELIDAVSSLASLRNVFERLSDLAAKHYLAAGRVKAGENLLGDLAAIKYEQGDYAAAAAYFSRMAGIFAETGWSFVQTTMLKMHAKCLKKLNRKDQYTSTLLELLAKAAAQRKASLLPTVSSASGEEERVKDPKRFPGWLDDEKIDATGYLTELIDFSDQLPYDVTVPMAKYFGDISVDQFLRHYDDKDGFQLCLHFRHLLQDELAVQKARVRLVCIASPNKEIWLESDGPQMVKRGLCKTWLDSNVTTSDTYTVDKIELVAKKIIFLHEPLSKAEASTPLHLTTSVSAASLKQAKRSRILCYPHKESLNVDVLSSRLIHIDKPRSIEVECHSGWNDITSAKFHLKPASAGLRLHTADAKVVDGSADVETLGAGQIKLGKIPASSKVKIQIPFDLETTLPSIIIGVDCTYTTEKGEFHWISSSTVAVDLPLDVNVHDHFKGSALFQKFNIKTPTNVPLEVLNVSLEGSEVYAVSSPPGIQYPITVFPKQPASMTYKITKQGVISEKPMGASSLALTVDYESLEERVVEHCNELFTRSVAESPFAAYARLLPPAFLERLRTHVLPNQYERIVLTQKIHLGDFDDLAWHEVVEALHPSSRPDMNTWLRKWHASHRTIVLPSLVPPEPRRIIITVTVPRAHIVHIASLIYHTPPTLGNGTEPLSLSHPLTLPLGKPCLATLKLRHTRQWTSPASLCSAANLTDPDEAMEFIYEIEANPDVWLIGGQRRAVFSAREGEVKEFGVLLIPIRPGVVGGVGVDVRARIKGEEAAVEEGKGKEREELVSEVEWRNAGESVYVVDDAREVTAAVVKRGGERGMSVGVLLEAVGRG